MRLIAITGGIGSGKSVVARIVQVMGYSVYDCDSRAKSLMLHDDEVKRQLVDAFGKETYHVDGTINKEHLSKMAFADDQTLKRLNAIVHPATASDMLRWADTQASKGVAVTFIETALLRTAGLDKMVDEVWHVTAPVELRITRVMARSGLTSAQVKERISAQAQEEAVAECEKEIINTDDSPLLPRIIKLLKN